MRIERYFEGGTEPGETVSTRPSDALPALRERALRSVCPVYASYLPRTASRQGLQPLRRYPLLQQQLSYKVRYFNWFPYAKGRSSRTLISSSIPR